MTHDDSPDNMKIYAELRLDIIHGQICLASFFKWKRDLRQRQVNTAKSNFKLAILEDAAAEA